MGPVAVAGYVMIGAAAALALILGAFAGAIAWAAQRSLLLFFLLAAAGYFGETVLLGSARLAPAAVIGIPFLILTLLTSWLTARYLEAHARLRRIWAALAGLCGALVLGFFSGFSLRLGVSAAVSLALTADACLIVLFFRSRTANAE